MDDTVLLALGLTLFAGLSTGIGSLFAFFHKKTSSIMIFHHTTSPPLLYSNNLTIR